MDVLERNLHVCIKDIDVNTQAFGKRYRLALAGVDLELPAVLLNVVMRIIWSGDIDVVGCADRQGDSVLSLIVQAAEQFGGDGIVDSDGVVD